MIIIAKALVCDKNKKVLILRRSITHPNCPHHSDFPGGEVGVNEADILGVIREIYEEAGIVVSEASVKLVYEKIARKDVKYILYTAEIDEPEPKVTLSWEHDAYTWKTTEELLNEKLPENVDHYYLSVIEYLRSSAEI